MSPGRGIDHRSEPSSHLVGADGRVVPDWAVCYRSIQDEILPNSPVNSSDCATGNFPILTWYDRANR